VSLFMDHNNNGGGSGVASVAGGMGPSGGMGGMGPMGSPNVRAPDATRSMRLVGGPPSPGGGGGNNNNNDAAAAAALMAAVGGPNAAQQMMMMGMMGGGGGGGFAAAGGGGIGNHDPMEDVMANTWASRDLRETVNQAAAASARGNRRNRSASGGGGGSMSHHDGANNNNDNNSSRRRRTGSRSHSSSSAAARNNNNDNHNNNNDSGDDEVQVVDQDGNIVGEVMEESDEDSYHYNDDDDDSDDDSMGAGGANDPPIQPNRQHNPPSLSTMFQPPNHLIHRAGGFLGAKNFAKDARRWLLVNIQTEDDFACHALNRDVWHDELVENLVREGFVFWQIASTSPEGMTYCQRYKVEGYPHIAIIDPRTGSLLYRKEGWTQVNPLTSEQFVEIASDFCSRHSFDKLPMPARHGYAAAGGSGSGGGFGMGGGESRPAKRPVHELSEQEQLEAAIRASMQDASGEQQSDDDGDDDEVQVLEDNDAGGIGKSIEDETTTKSTGQEENDNNNANEEEKQEEESKLSPFTTEILSMTVPTEPTTTTGQANIAKVQLRMPNGKRLVRKFNGDLPVKVIYAFCAQLDDSNIREDAKAGRAFELKAKFPPVDLMPFVEDSISSFGLSGEAITFLWK